MVRQRVTSWLAAALFALPVACSDDDDAPASSDNEAAEAGRAAAGRGGSGGRGGRGGATSSRDDAAESGDGKAGEGAADGDNASSKGGRGGAGGAAGSGNAQAGSSAGGSAPSDDAGVVDGESPAAVTKLSDRRFTQANDLRGLTYSSSGKIWASGHTDSDAMNRQLVIARFNADGTPDTSFNEDGFLVFDAGPGDEQSLGLVELADGDIVVQANVSDNQGGAAIADTANMASGVRANGANVVLFRFNADGTPETSFGQNGRALVKFGWAPEDDASWPVPTYTSTAPEAMRYSGPGFPSDQAWGIELDKSGSEEKLVVNGFGPAAKAATGEQRYDNDRYVARLLASSGAPDSSFNGGAAYTFNTQGVLSDGGRRATVESDGTIISAGYTNLGEGLGNHVVLLRLKPDGTPDTSFGFGTPSLPGVGVFNPFVANGGVAECYAAVRQPNGRYITTGYGRATAAGMSSSFGYATTDQVDLVSFAVNSEGKAVDQSWGVDGTRAIQSEEFGLAGTEDRGRDLVALPDGRTIQVGRFGASPALFVLTPTGALDTAAGERGVFSYEPFESTATPPAATSHFFAVALSADGKRVAASTNNHANGVLLAVLQIAE